MIIEYSGKGFHGSQYQVGVRTVQAELERALAILAHRPVTVVFSGRTDAGVHAHGQVIHFDWPHLNVDCWRLAWQLNGILPDDLAVQSASVVSEAFHARYSATDREYVYRILNRSQRSAALRDTHFFVSRELDVSSMIGSCLSVCGEHDFSAFKSSNSDRRTAICHVSRAELLILGEGVLEFWIASNRFVYNMVRIIVGTLIEIGLGKKRPEIVSEALDTKSRCLAGPTAPAWGLCLNRVYYPDSFGCVSKVGL